MTQAVLQSETTPILYVAFELSNSTWKMAMGIGEAKIRFVDVAAGNVAAVDEAIAKAKAHFALPTTAAVRSCYEAGRDGFWLHRTLLEKGIENVVVDSSSIQVDRRSRRAKTDRLDGRQLLIMLVRHCNEHARVWSVVRVPTLDEEDRRRTHRELERLKKERTAHRVRIISLLKLHGLDFRPGRSALGALDVIRLRDGAPLPPHLLAELHRQKERLQLVERQIAEIDKQRAAIVAAKSTTVADKVRRMSSLRGIGTECSWVCVHELFAWRSFSNRRQLAGAVGLTPTPYQSGDGAREQGISKSGNQRVRHLMVQIAWGWLRHQPDSALSRWFERRFGHGRGRMRRVGIVALARRLLVALWRFVEDGVVPEGARLKSTI